MAIREMKWDVPVLPHAEVLVVGGGSAGIAAATAAARNGAETVLVERYGFLGGTAAAALVGPFMTSYDAQGERPVVGGLFREVVDRMIALAGAVDPAEARAGSAYASFIELGHDHVTPFDVEALKHAALEMVVDSGVKLMLHTYFVDALTARNEEVPVGEAGEWQWTSHCSDGSLATLNVPEPGVYSIQMLMYDDGLCVDKIYLTTGEERPDGLGLVESALCQSGS